MKRNILRAVLALLLLVFILSVVPVTAHAEGGFDILDIEYDFLNKSAYQVTIKASVNLPETEYIELKVPIYQTAETRSLGSGGIFYGYETAVSNVVSFNCTNELAADNLTISLYPERGAETITLTFVYEAAVSSIDTTYLAEGFEYNLYTQVRQTPEAAAAEQALEEAQQAEEEQQRAIDDQYEDAAGKIRRDGISVDVLTERYYTSGDGKDMDTFTDEALDILQSGDIEGYFEYWESYYQSGGYNLEPLLPEVEERLREEESQLLREYAENRANYFVTDNYHVDIVVDKNGTYNVTETIGVTFLKPRHGLYRTLPRSGSMILPDHGVLREWQYKARISNVKVQDWKYKVSKNDVFEDRKETEIKIGDADTYVTDQQQYVISYTYRLPTDPYDEYDVIHHYLFPKEWEEPILNASATIQMPDTIDKDSVSFEFDDVSAAEKNQVDWAVSGNRIDLSLKSPLDRNQGVKIDVRLPEGYFERSSLEVFSDALIADTAVPGLNCPLTARELLFIGICTVIVLIAFLVWLCTGVNLRQPIVPVEVTPPDGMNPAEVGYIIDASVDAKDISALIIYWAGQGRIQIEPSEYEKKVYKLTKTSSLPASAKKYEHEIFNALFKYGKSIYSNEFSKNTALKSALRIVETQIPQQYLQVKPGTTLTLQNMVYTSGSGSTSLGLLVWTIMIQVVMLAFMVWRQPMAICAIAGYIWYLIFFCWRVMACTQSSLKLSRRFAELFPRLLIVGIMSFAMAALMGKIIYDSWIYAIVCTVACVLLTLMAGACKKRTKLGQKLFGRILGYRKYIKLVEHDRAIAMLQESPNSVYEILAYAYVLDITRAWVKHFETFDMPGFVVVEQRFSSSDIIFDSMMHSHFAGASSSGGRSYSSDSSSSSSSSGGSSGGSGGGGGGSW